MKIAGPGSEAASGSNPDRRWKGSQHDASVNATRKNCTDPWRRVSKLREQRGDEPRVEDAVVHAGAANTEKPHVKSLEITKVQEVRADQGSQGPADVRDRRRYARGRDHRQHRR